jgi:hypothetical protein
MSQWTKLRREGGESPEDTPLVTIRQSGLAFNAAFARAASLRDKSHVAVHLAPASFRIGLKFLDDASDADSYALTRDGGGRGEGRHAQCTTLVRVPWVAAVARIEDRRLLAASSQLG